MLHKLPRPLSGEPFSSWFMLIWHSVLCKYHLITFPYLLTLWTEVRRAKKAFPIRISFCLNGWKGAEAITKTEIEKFASENGSGRKERMERRKGTEGEDGCQIAQFAHSLRLSLFLPPVAAFERTNANLLHFQGAKRSPTESRMRRKSLLPDILFSCFILAIPYSSDLICVSPSGISEPRLLRFSLKLPSQVHHWGSGYGKSG